MDLFYKVRQHVLKELDGMVAAGELPDSPFAAEHQVWQREQARLAVAHAS